MKANRLCVLLLVAFEVLQLFEAVFEVKDGLLAVLKMLNRLPGCFLRRKALPQHLVLDDSLVVCPLDDAIHLPLLMLQAHLYVI